MLGFGPLFGGQVKALFQLDCFSQWFIAALIKSQWDFSSTSKVIKRDIV